ncbi:14544_t:CDS:1, partial [Funneliformis mosseae]
DCSIGEGKRDCHSGFSCSSDNDCIFKLCENFVCVRKLSRGCVVGGKKNNCRLGDPCVSSDDCQTPGCAENDSGTTVCV